MKELKNESITLSSEDLRNKLLGDLAAGVVSVESPGWKLSPRGLKDSLASDLAHLKRSNHLIDASADGEATESSFEDISISGYSVQSPNSKKEESEEDLVNFKEPALSEASPKKSLQKSEESEPLSPKSPLKS